MAMKRNVKKQSFNRKLNNGIRAGKIRSNKELWAFGTWGGDIANQKLKQVV